MQQACETAVAMLDDYAPMEVVCERYPGREPHLGGQEAFTIRSRFPWHSRLQTRVMMEVTTDERILCGRSLRLQLQGISSDQFTWT